MRHNGSATKQRLHPQSVAEISRHSVLPRTRFAGFVFHRAAEISSSVNWWGRLLSDICCRRVLPCIRTWRSNFLSCGALATWMRWAATALALTDGCVDLDGCWQHQTSVSVPNSSGLNACVHLRRQFFPTMLVSCIKWLDEMVSYVWVTRLFVLHSSSKS